MKTYRLWFKHPGSEYWLKSAAEPYVFGDVEEAQTELAIRTFKYGYQYKIMESEEQQS